MVYFVAGRFFRRMLFTVVSQCGGERHFEDNTTALIRGYYLTCNRDFDSEIRTFSSIWF